MAICESAHVCFLILFHVPSRLTRLIDFVVSYIEYTKEYVDKTLLIILQPVMCHQLSSLTVHLFITVGE